MWKLLVLDYDNACCAWCPLWREEAFSKITDEIFGKEMALAAKYSLRSLIS